MTAGISTVMQRMAQIDARFGRSSSPAVIGRPAPSPTTSGPSTTASAGNDPGAPTAPDFRNLFEQTTTEGLAVPPTSFATPLPASYLHPSMTMIDRLAAAGMLPVTGSSTGTAAAPATSGVAADHAGHAHAGHAHAGHAVDHAAPADATPTAAVPPTTPFAAQFEVAGAQHGVPPRLLAAVGWVESRYQVDAVSPDGAIGVMQFMPMTAQEMGVNPHDPIDAIDGAARLLADHHRRFGSWDLALAAYHSGAGAVSRNGNIPPPRAATYVSKVHDRLETM